MDNKIQITELDFDTIKSNLKTFLNAQTEFQDYDFEGSGLNILLDILAYNTHYNAYYLNMVANEAFLDTATLRDSVVSHAKTLGYFPYSSTAAKATVDLTVYTNSSTTQTLTLPRGFSFKSDLLNDISYNFVILDDVTATKSNTNFYFESLSIHEGTMASYDFTYNKSQNPKSLFVLPNLNIDTSTIKVTVRPSLLSSNTETYNPVESILEVTSTSKVYFIQENRQQYYEIYFGNDSVGKALQDGAIVNVSYLITSGPMANKIEGFVASDDINGYTNLTTTITPSSGGAFRESVDSIKYSAKSQFATQNRLVTAKDYEILIKKYYPAVGSVSVWGGEDEVPKIFGKMFISMKPKVGYYLSETEKQYILTDIIAPRSIVSVTTEIRDPEYLYVLIKSKVEYDAKKTTLSAEAIKNAVKTTIYNYKDTNLDTFGSSLKTSKLQREIDLTDPSIVGNDMIFKLQKRFIPALGSSSSYKVNFNVPLHRGTSSLNRLTSTIFNVLDSTGTERSVYLEEVPQSYTGLSSISIVNPGYDYTSNPIITITGDGSGAEAKAVVVNGKIENIIITKRGTDYSKAIITITDSVGRDAVASAVIDSKVGTLRTIYFDSNAERKIVDETAGTINYETGEIEIVDTKIISVSANDGYIRLTAESEEGLIESVRNTILTIDEDDSSSIEINLVKV